MRSLLQGAALCASLLFPSLFCPGLALAEGKSILVLDASGSMWGQIDGRAKLEIAREALASVVAEMPAETTMGLMAYGHREKGSCDDIELIVPAATGTGPAIIEAANALNFLGKTPLSEAVRRAAEALRSTEEKATVILITDGIETCNADPCALGAELEASGVDFTAHVVGFGLTEAEGAQVACLAENTGGQYIEAKNAGALVEALRTTVVVAPEPPAPEPEPEPAQPAALEANVDPVALMAEGGAEPETRVIEDIVFSFAPLGADDQPLGDETTIYGRSKDALAPGRYRMTTVLHEVQVEQIVEIGPATELSTPTAVLDAGILDLTLRPFDGAEPAPEGFWEVRGANELYDAGYSKAYRVLPSGEHALLVRLGAAEQTLSVVIEAGKVTVQDISLGTGLAMVDAFYTEAMKIDGGEHAVEILGSKMALDGSRKSFGYAYGAGARFDLPAGDYLAVVGLHAASVEVPFTVKVGERTEVKAVLNAGVLAVSAAGATSIEVFAAEPDLNGSRKSLAFDYAETLNKTMPEGDYVVQIKRGDMLSEVTASVKMGERTETTVP